MRSENGSSLEQVDTAFRDAEPGPSVAVEGSPVMTTPASVVTTTEDIALAAAASNAAAAAVDYANAVNG